MIIGENAVSMKLRLEQGTVTLSPVSLEEKENGKLYLFESREPAAKGRVCFRKKENLWLVTAGVELEQAPFRENNNLEAADPVIVTLSLKQPLGICAQYQHRDWWSRPAFGNSWRHVPARTQSLFVKYEKDFGCFIPMAGEKMKTYLQGNENSQLELHITGYTGGIHRFEETVLVCSQGTELYPVVEKGWQEACRIRHIPAKTGRKYPEMFEYLGWCSWDAFYTDITEEKVRQKAKEFTDKDLPVRWILMDDGWLSVKDQALYSLEPEKEKFPEGFEKMTREIRESTTIRHIGVWHAFGGYWGGILPGSQAAEECREYLYETKNEKLLPHFEPEKGFGFWRKWYALLRNQGIDFVKVDGQSALKNYYRNNEVIGKAAAGAHQALEAAAGLFMDGNLINCMGMAAENVMNRPVSGLSRNSDDFVPEDEKGFREHMLQNSFNAVWHSQIYFCDWDMFWTKHEDAVRHALVRAVSGGPIYFSDRIGETRGEVLEPLIYGDGKILRMERSALPAPDCIFDFDPDHKNLTLTNTVNHTGAAALFHLGETDGEFTTNLCAADVYGLEGERFLVYDYFSGSCHKCKRHETEPVTLKRGGYALRLFLPIKDEITPIGLTDKYMSSHSLEYVLFRTPGDQEKECEIIIKDGGRFSFYTQAFVSRIYVQDEDLTDRLEKEECLYHISLERKGRQRIRILYEAT